MTWTRVILALAVLAGMLHASEASAQPAPSCTISATSVNFGNYNVFNSAAVDSTGTITYSCNSHATSITISLSKGASSSYNQRIMIKGAESLTYNLFTDAAKTSVWGDGTGGTSVYSRTNPSNNTNVNLTVYGQIPPGQDVSAGTFSDTVSATINF
jgi:spore coat protein U domain-containing protein, fimbrial subunit CupE1/2/3/6